MKNNLKFLLPISLLLCASCGLVEEAQRKSAVDWTFQKDFTLLNQYADCHVLADGDSYIAVSPKLQARVLVASLDGVKGESLGWYNRKMIVNGTAEYAHNIIGGIDRFSLAPEGGDNALFFKKGDSIIAENWKAPAFLSTEPWQVIAKDEKHILFEKSASVVNAKDAKFDIKVLRQISILDKAQAGEFLGTEIAEDINMVAFQSINKITNEGSAKWQKEDGLIAESLQSCFTAGGNTYAFIPYKNDEGLGNMYNDKYFDASDNEFRFLLTDDYARLRVDAKKLIEIGVNAKRSKSMALAYDANKNILTVVTYVAPSVDVPYITSMWQRSDDTLNGDAISVFNDGVSAQSSFDFDNYYEITTNSPALALEAKASQLHVHRVYQFYGSEYELGLLSEKLAGISIEELMVEED
ncbi:MAG: DUF6786 family protein [Opitutales bacterium]